MVDWGTWAWPVFGRYTIEPCPVTKGLVLVVVTVGWATEVTTGKLGVSVVAEAPQLIEYCAAVMQVAAIGFKIPAFAGSLAVAAGELLTH